MRIQDDDDERSVNAVAAALIADSAIFKASGKLEQEARRFRERIGDVYSESAEEINAMIQSSAIKIVYKPNDA